jgi:subfamily B ATP-binding cassette protein MsbA
MGDNWTDGAQSPIPVHATGSVRYGPRMLVDPGARAEMRALIIRFGRPLALGLTLTLLDRLTSFTMPALSKIVVDQVAGQHRLDLIPPVGALAVTALLVQAATTFASQRSLGLVGQRVVTELRTSLLVRILALPLSFFDRSSLGSLVSRILTDTGQIENLIGSGLVQLIGALLTALIGLAVMLHLNWQLTLAVIAVLGVYATWGARAFARLRRVFTSSSETNARTTARLTETLAGISVVKAYAAERHESAAFSTVVEQQYEAAAQTITGVASLSAGMILMNGANTVLLFVGGGYAVVRGRMTLGDLVAFVVCVSLLASPLLQLSAMTGTVGKALAALSRIHELQTLPGEDDTDELRTPLPDITGAVAIEQVHYSYVPGEPALRGIDFNVPAGATVALVGPSGSGKSTLCRLLLAFDRPSSGRILVDGRDLTTVKLRDYRVRLGVVLQDTFLFDGTVRDLRRAMTRCAPSAGLHTATSSSHASPIATRRWSASVA